MSNQSGINTRQVHLIRPTPPRLATRHNLHQRSPSSRRSALSSALSHNIIHHSRLLLTAKAQRARSISSGARWGPDSGYFLNIFNALIKYEPFQDNADLVLAEWCLRLARRISRTSFSAGTRMGRRRISGSSSLSLGYDKPAILRYTNRQISLIDADGENFIKGNTVSYASSYRDVISIKTLEH